MRIVLALETVAAFIGYSHSFANPITPADQAKSSSQMSGGSMTRNQKIGKATVQAWSAEWDKQKLELQHLRSSAFICGSIFAAFALLRPMISCHFARGRG
jgi:hypothetical protein